ncbi:MAG TPA: hypothetical protein PKY87_08075 [Terricaulis sp.]|nr:hypothetical protein [Terricaulis sp.]
MSVVYARQQLQAAAIAEGGALDPEVQAALGEALAKVSPVDAVVGAFRALKDHVEDLGEALTQALRAGALAISESDFHGLAAEAGALAATLPEPTPTE